MFCRSVSLSRQTKSHEELRGAHLNGDDPPASMGGSQYLLDPRGTSGVGPRSASIDAAANGGHGIRLAGVVAESADNLDTPSRTHLSRRPDSKFDYTFSIF